MTAYKKAMITAPVFLACAILFASCLLGYDIDDLRRTAWTIPANVKALPGNIWLDDAITVPQGIKWYEILNGINTYNDPQDGQWYDVIVPVWWNDQKQGDRTKTLDIEVYAYYSDGTIFELSNQDSAWNENTYSQYNHPPRNIHYSNSNGKVYLMVRAKNNSRNTGTFSIAYGNDYLNRPATSTDGIIALNYQWYERHISAGETHYYRYQAYNTEILSAEWEDASYTSNTLPISSPIANIKVAVKKEGDSSYVLNEIDDATGNRLYFPVYVNRQGNSSGYSNMIIEVHGYSEGNYVIRRSESLGYYMTPGEYMLCSYYNDNGGDFYWYWNLWVSPGTYTVHWADRDNNSSGRNIPETVADIGEVAVKWHWRSDSGSSYMDIDTVPDGTNEITFYADSAGIVSIELHSNDPPYDPSDPESIFVQYYFYIWCTN